MDGDFKATGLNELRSRLKDGIRQLDLGQAVVLRDLAQMFRQGEADVFRSEGAALGKRWAQLKASTVKGRRRLIAKFGLQIRPSHPILVNYGDLRAAMTSVGEAQHQRIHGSMLTITVAQDQINRHNRKRGLGMTTTSTGRRRKPRGKGGRYPPNMIDIQEKRGRKIVGVPGYKNFEMEARVARYLKNVAKAITGPGGGPG